MMLKSRLRLKSLEEHNEERSKYWRGAITLERKNGIACPLCGDELLDTNHMVTLTSNPPQKNVQLAHKKGMRAKKGFGE